VDSTKVRETRMVIGDSHALWRSTHFKPHITKSDVRLKLSQYPPDPHQNGLSTALEGPECAGFRYYGMEWEHYAILICHNCKPPLVEGWPQPRHWD
jgi:hypothetical protein